MNTYSTKPDYAASDHADIRQLMSQCQVQQPPSTHRADRHARLDPARISGSLSNGFENVNRSSIEASGRYAGPDSGPIMGYENFIQRLVSVSLKSLTSTCVATSPVYCV